MNTAELQTAINLWCTDQNTALANFGHITNWDTSDVTDMGNLLCGVNHASYMAYCKGGLSYCGLTESQTFDEDLSGWDTSKVTTFHNMFQSAYNFKGVGLEHWDTSKVTSFEHMFWDATSFQGLVDNWDTSNVVNMDHSFKGFVEFNPDISQWDVGSVAIFFFTFSACFAFNADISSWNTAKTTTMEYMFTACDVFNWDISSWDIGKVTSLKYMFLETYEFEHILCWDVAGKDTESMLLNSPSGSVDKDHPKCACSAGDFYDSAASACSPCPTGSWSSAKADTCPYSCPDGWFRTYPGSLECTASCPPGRYVDSSIASCQACASGKYSSLIGRTTECTDACPAGKFSGEAAIQCDNFIPGEYQDALGQALCVKCVAGRHSAVTGLTSSCQKKCSPGSYSLEGAAICSLCGAGSYQDTVGMDSCKDCMAGTASSDVNRSSCDTCLPNSYAPAGSSACLPCAAGSLAGAGVCLNPMDSATLRLAVTAWCDDKIAATNNYGHISHWDTSSVTDMSSLFHRGPYCSGTFEFNEDISSWDTSSVTSMAYMFRSQASFNVDISGWDTSKVTSFNYIFFNAFGFNVDIRAWNLGSAQTMNHASWNQAHLKYCWNINHLNTGFFGYSPLESAWSGFYNPSDPNCETILDHNDPSGAVCSCTVGEYYDGTVCALCPIWKTSHGKTDSCKACPPGFTTTSAGSPSSTFESGNNGCLAGIYLPMGESDCSDCEPGKFTNMTGATSCQPCASGKVSPVAGSTIGCINECPAGQYSGLPAV